MSFPVALSLEGRLAVVVGSSSEARLRAERLLVAGARVRWIKDIVALAVEEALQAETRLVVLERAAEETDLDGAWLLVYADANRERAAELCAWCESRCCFFCAIDMTELNSFNHVALVEALPVRIAVSTGGKVPALARQLRKALERLLDDGKLAAYARHLERLRNETPPDQRKERLNEALQGFGIDGRLVIPPFGHERGDDGGDT